MTAQIDAVVPGESAMQCDGLRIRRPCTRVPRYIVISDEGISPASLPEGEINGPCTLRSSCCCSSCNLRRATDVRLVGSKSVLSHTHNIVLSILQVVPSANLSWASCYDTFSCAKLKVRALPLWWKNGYSTSRNQLPLQYSDPGAGEATIALIMSASNYSSTDAEYLGPVLFNPGMRLHRL